MAEEEQKGQALKRVELRKRLKIIAGICVSFFLLSVGGYVYLELIDASAIWGQVGDFLGGVLNPIFGLASLIALLFTISMQSEELDLSRTEMKKTTAALNAQNDTLKIQRFENTFFQLVQLHNNIVNDMDIWVGSYYTSLEPQLITCSLFMQHWRELKKTRNSRERRSATRFDQWQYAFSWK